MKISIKQPIRSDLNQSGQAAIFITLILMLVMGIIALAASLTVSRNTRNALNYQEGIQANYAAESGINDAIAAMQNGLLPSGGNCTSFTDAVATNSAVGLTPNANGSVPLQSSNPKVAYTCITADGTPPSVVLPVTNLSSIVATLNISPATNAITFSWPTNGGSLAGCTPSEQFVQPKSWSCSAPVLRVDLFDDTSNGMTPSNYSNAAQLEANTLSFFFLPIKDGAGSNSVNFTQSPPPQPAVVQADCPSVGSGTMSVGNCYETLNMPAGSPFADGYARITSIYDTVRGSRNVSITANGVTSGAGSGFSGAQIQIDSTGIDQDEVQRLDVRVPTTATATPPNAPNYAADGGTVLCKRHVITNGSADPGVDVSHYNIPPNEWPLCGPALKPAIYLYPTHPEPVNVQVGWPTGLKTTIPAYNPTNGWNVIAQPDGTITNLADGQSYPYLYWEGNQDNLNFDMSKGFVVPGKDTATFLQKELKIIGLNQNEIKGFLAYWVPKMQNNPYSLIHFAGSEYTNMAPLNITPRPDSMLRVFMAELPISQPVKVTPQHFSGFERKGFTAVEWGGSVLGSASSAN